MTAVTAVIPRAYQVFTLCTQKLCPLLRVLSSRARTPSDSSSRYVVGVQMLQGYSKPNQILQSDVLQILL